MDVELYHGLVEAARASETVNYRDLGDMLHMDFGNLNDRRRVGDHVGEISRFEVAWPMLSSVVIHRNDFQPAKGVFALGRDLAVVEPGEDAMAFVTRQLKAAWATLASSKDRPPS